VDVELLIIKWLPSQLENFRGAESFRVCTDLPLEMGMAIGDVTIRVNRTSGANRHRFTENPIVDIDVFAPQRSDAVEVALLIQGMFAGIRNLVTEQGVVQSVQTVIGSRWLPDINQDLVRYSASYELHTHL
jgi:hypothetical protein